MVIDTTYGQQGIFNKEKYSFVGYLDMCKARIYIHEYIYIYIYIYMHIRVFAFTTLKSE
jgi:hypothetical protein